MANDDDSAHKWAQWYTEQHDLPESYWQWEETLETAYRAGAANGETEHGK